MNDVLSLTYYICQELFTQPCNTTGLQSQFVKFSLSRPTVSLQALRMAITVSMQLRAAITYDITCMSFIPHIWRTVTSSPAIFVLDVMLCKTPVTVDNSLVFCAVSLNKSFPTYCRLGRATPGCGEGLILTLASRRPRGRGQSWGGERRGPSSGTRRLFRGGGKIMRNTCSQVRSGHSQHGAGARHNRTALLWSGRLVWYVCLELVLGNEKANFHGH